MSERHFVFVLFESDSQDKPSADHLIGSVSLTVDTKIPHKEYQDRYAKPAIVCAVEMLKRRIPDPVKES